MALHFLMRRSKAEGEGSQENSLDMQRVGCKAFAAKHGIAGPALEHVSDGVAGDDVEGLVALRRLVDAAKPGDVIVCRDHSRLGRDMLESAMTIRTLVEERRASLFYYSNGEQVHWRNATDAVMTVLRGFGAQSEVEHIRSRTVEGLRLVSTSGHVAGGACYGYTNVRHSDARGNHLHTTAEINATEASIVRRIFAEYIAGAGYTKIAKGLNDDRVPAPSAGTKRGTKSWAPSAVREILRRERYIGISVHGKVKREKKGGKRVVTERNRANATRTLMPEWQIIADETWRAAQDLIAERAGAPRKPQSPAAKHPLTGLARCAHCGGGLTLAYTKTSGGRRVPAYVCNFHWKRGTAVCPVAIRQPQDEVEEQLQGYVDHALFAPGVIAEALRSFRSRAEAAFPEPSDVGGLEAELTGLKAEQRRLARAVALAEDVDELAAELRDRNARIKALEARLVVAQRAPAERAALIDAMEAGARAALEDIREALANGAPAAVRAAYRALFPDGLRFHASPENDNRRVWIAEGVPSLAGATLPCDPTEIRPKVALTLPTVRVELRRAA